MKPIEPLGTIDGQRQSAGEEEEDDVWQSLINHAWAKDWSDPREDIYTLEDGQPSHESR